MEKEWIPFESSYENIFYRIINFVIHLIVFNYTTFE